MRKLKDLTRTEKVEIALDYAHSPVNKTSEFFAEEYNISVSTFHNMVKDVILQSLISVDEARLIAQKAAENAERHAGRGARKRVLDFYESLIRQRATYRLNRNEARKWTKKYIESDLDLETFAKYYNLKGFLLKRALHDSFIYSWINDNEVNLLIEKNKKQKSENLDEVFEKMLKQRNLRKQAKTPV